MVCYVIGGVTSMDSFLEKFFPAVYRKEASVKASDDQYCKFNNQTLTLFTSSLYLAALISSICAASITRRFGRRTTMLSGGVLFCAGALVNGFAQRVWMLIVGRLLLGFGIGCANQVYYIFIQLSFDVELLEFIKKRYIIYLYTAISLSLLIHI
jgi:MFS family permease